LQLVSAAGIWTVTRVVEKLRLPLDDAPVVAGAIAAEAAVLVMGDRMHFGHLYKKGIRGIKVLPPADILARLLARIA
jgi:hypothetical protein